MANYNFTECLSPIDFELLSKDILEADLSMKLENFSEGRDQGIDLRYAPVLISNRIKDNSGKKQKVIVQCKRYSTYADLKSKLKNEELPKIIKLNPKRYILTTSVSLTVQNVDELQSLLSPYIQSTSDIYGRERLNSILSSHHEIERRHIKLWISSAGVFDSIIHANTHIVSREEIDRTVQAAKLYVRNSSFDEALNILKKHHVCIISGLPGIGKTTLARMLLLYFFRKEYDIVKIESDISEARSVGYHNNPRFYYYDDFLGQTAQADKLNKNEDQKLLDFMVSIRDSKDSVFVLTTREYILNQAKLQYEKLDREKFDHEICIIDLSSYSRKIKAQILYNHLNFSKLQSNFIKSLIVKRGYLKIVDHKNYNPRIIESLTNMSWLGKINSSQYLEYFLQKLNNPVEIWEHAFRNQLSDRSRHLLFVLTTMPYESYIENVKYAFTSFHALQCKKFNITHSANDFINALKELEGTFTKTYKVQGIVSVSFQNPSIRDFMQNLLLDGEFLLEVIDSLVFFEQARWFVDILNEENSQISHTTILKYAPNIGDSLRRLFDVQIDINNIAKGKNTVVFNEIKKDAALRLVVIASFFKKNKYLEDKVWMDNEILKLASDLEFYRVRVCEYFINSIEKLKVYGYLNTDTEKKITGFMKMQIMEDYDNDFNDFDFYGFEILVKIIDAFPEIFDNNEIDAIQKSYSDFVSQYAKECDFASPEEFREEALTIQDMGDVLDVDTKKAQDILRNAADEIEEKQQEKWDDFDNDDRPSYKTINSVECSDIELDSMFGTLDI